MQHTSRIFHAALGLALGALCAASVLAQEVLPKPEPPFGGKIGETYKDSTPDFPKPVAAPAEAPNVLIVILDDVRFGHAGPFGGAVATPTMNRLAKEGLRYNTFHTTALCSSTRGALLTGRKHPHSVGTGVIIELGTGFPGYRGIVPNTTAGFPKILRQNGYAIAAFGKWHNTPDVEKYRIQSSEALPTGKSNVRVEFTPIEPGPGKPAAVKLYVNCKQTGEGRVDKTVPSLQRGAIRRRDGYRLRRIGGIQAADRLQGANRAGEDRAEVRWTGSVLEILVEEWHDMPAVRPMPSMSAA